MNYEHELKNIFLKLKCALNAESVKHIYICRQRTK